MAVSGRARLPCCAEEAPQQALMAYRLHSVTRCQLTVSPDGVWHIVVVAAFVDGVWHASLASVEPMLAMHVH